MAARATFIWGLKRSGIHLVADWLYANHGGTSRSELTTQALHPALSDGYCDEAAGVAFYNNCGRFHCRKFELGDLMPADFQRAALQHDRTIFGVEDCSLRYAERTALADSVNVLVLRDPLNNLASRLEAARTKPELFRVDEAYVDLMDTYCLEFLGRSNHLTNKLVVSFNRFVEDPEHRNSLAAELGLPNLDVVSEVSSYGGGSSFAGMAVQSPTALMNRFHQRPIPRRLIDMLLARSGVTEACSAIFGYDLETRLGEI